MRAAVYRKYGPRDVVRIEQVPTPVPQDHEVLARPFFGLRAPRKPILGTELAGTIEAVGRTVTRFQIGEAVFAFPGAAS